MKALVLLVLGAVLAAVPAAQAKGQHDVVSVSSVSCAPGYTTVTCSFVTSSAAPGYVATGTAKSVVIPTTDTAKSREHSITVRGLEPGTRYYAEVGAADGGRGVWAQFATLGPGTDGGGLVGVTTEGTHWLLNGGKFIPIVAYTMNTETEAPVNTCIAADQVATLRETGARIALTNQPYSKHDQGCGTTQAAQITTMGANLTGRMSWNYGGDQPTLGRDITNPDEDAVLDFPATHDALFIGQGYGPRAGKANVVWYPNPMAQFMKPTLAVGTPALGGINIPSGGNIGTDTIPNQFCSATAQGAGIDYSLYSVSNGNTFDPEPKRLALAGKLSGQLATMSPVLLYGKKLSSPLDNATLYSFKFGKTFRVRPARNAALYAYRYGGRVYLQACSESFWLHTNGQGNPYYYKWWRATVHFKLNGLGQSSVRGLFGAKGLKLAGNTVTLSLGIKDADWFVLTPRR